MPGAFACATALAFLYDGVFCIDYLDPRMYSFPVTTMTLAMIRRSYSTASLHRL
ncbi:hypothetical protein [Escherichia coli]|uniref:hypothetical protein n=1 Tax=Escherichia coli TaxID=562 RepID=UPI0013EBE647|nr:hypothetical protein [Escherichia coli]